MDLSKDSHQARFKFVFNDGQTLIGRIVDYTSSLDSNDEKAYFTIVPEGEEFKGKYAECPESEIKVIVKL